MTGSIGRCNSAASNASRSRGLVILTSFSATTDGNLDSRTSLEIMQMLRDLNKTGKTIIMVTHETDIAAWARRVVRLRDGRVESDTRNDSRQMVEMGQ